MTDAGHDSLEDKLQHSVDSLCKEKQLPVTTLVYGNNVICLASAPTQEKQLRRQLIWKLSAVF